MKSLTKVIILVLAGLLAMMFVETGFAYKDAFTYQDPIAQGLVDYQEVKRVQAEKQAEIARLEAEKQAKALEAQKLASKKSNALSDPKVVVTGNKLDWLAQAGIAESDWVYATSIIQKESGWQPFIWNHSGSGAYGLCQSLPASKMATAGSDYMTNPVTQLRWCNSYAQTRYGSWSNAYKFWQLNHWW